MTQLVEVIRKYQGDLSPSDYADLLRISRVQLWRVLEGKGEQSRAPGTRLIGAFLRAFPEATAEVTAAMTSDAQHAVERSDRTPALSVAP